MDIKYPPLISVTAEIKSAKMMLGKVVIDASVKGRSATMTLSQDEAKKLVEHLMGAMAPKL